MANLRSLQSPLMDYACLGEFDIQAMEDVKDDLPVGKQPLASSFTTYVAMTKCMLGSGMLSMSLAIEKTGLVGGVILALVTCVFSTLGFIFWGLATWVSCSSSFHEAYVRQFPEKQRDQPCWFLNIAIFGNGVLAMMAVATLFGDLITSILEGISSQSSPFLTRSFLLPVWRVLVITPLTVLGGLADLSRFKYIYMIGLGALFYVMVVLVIDTIMVGAAHQLPEMPVHGSAGFWGAVDLFGIFAGGFMCHYMAPKMFDETVAVAPGALRASTSEAVRFCKVAACAFLTTCGVFLVFGFVGYARFGTAVEGNLLKTYRSHGSPHGVPAFLVFIMWISILISVSITFVFIYNLTFEAFVNLVRDAKRSKTFDFTKAQKIALTIVVLALLTVSGIFLKQLAVLSFLRGATLDLLLCYIVPSIILIRVLQNFKDVVLPMYVRLFLNVASIVLIVVGTFVAVVSILAMCLGKADL